MIRLTLFLVALLSLATFGVISTVSASNYSAGTYGTCAYNSCSIGLTSSSSVAVDITPTGGSTRCTVQSNTVRATTDSSTGYTVTINNGDTVSTLNGPSAQTIPSTAGSATNPIALTANTWGYRVDSIAGFGAGPTSAVSSGAIPSVSFAAIPISSATADIIRTTNTTDGVPFNIPVWFGVCVDATKPAGTYSDSIVFTATVN